MNRRGSALSYVIVVVFSITSVVLVSARLSSNTEAEFNHRYDEAKFEAMADGVVAEAIADAYRGTLTTGDRTSTIGTKTLAARVTQSTKHDRAYDVRITAVIGDRTYATTRTIGKRARPHPLFYGVWSGGTHADAAFATTIVGSIYVGGDATFTGVSSVSEDALVRGISTIPAANVGGHTLAGARAQSFIAPIAANYTSAGSTITSPAVNLSFTGLDASGNYPVRYSTGNLNMSGLLSGKGTVFVQGNLIIDGNVNYATADSRVVFIVTGNVRVNAGVTSIAGTYYGAGRATLNSTNLNVQRGNICVSDVVNRAGPLNITQDDAFLTAPSEAQRHRVPGL